MINLILFWFIIVERQKELLKKLLRLQINVEKDKENK